MAQLAKDMPPGVKIEVQEDVYRLTLPGMSAHFLAQLDRNTLMLAGKKEQIAAARDKASGKKKTALKYPSVRAFLKQRQPDQAVQIAADADSVWGTSVAVRANGGARVTEVKHTTLGDMGVLSLLGSYTVGEKIKGGVTLKTKDADKAKALADKFLKGLDEAKTELARAVQRQKELAPLVKTLESVTVKLNEATVRISGEMDGEVIQTALKMWFTAPVAAPPAPAPPARK
jgi:hypothetical protein